MVAAATRCSGGYQDTSSSSSLIPSRRSTAARSIAVAVSPASPANEARMACRESISVMSRSKPTGPISLLSYAPASGSFSILPGVGTGIGEQGQRSQGEVGSADREDHDRDADRADQRAADRAAQRETERGDGHACARQPAAHVVG